VSRISLTLEDFVKACPQTPSSWSDCEDFVHDLQQVIALLLADAAIDSEVFLLPVTAGLQVPS